jgi:uncharacterized membrane protein (UPF0127 family)
MAAVAMLCAVPGGQALAEASAAQKVRKVTVTIDTRQGPRVFNVEVARTSAEQERGLMFRTGLPADGGMIFTPYPPDGGAPRQAQFWMKNTPTALDIIFIRADGTIARVAADAQPYSEDHVLSGEPIAAVLEIVAGKSAELGIAVGDKVRWKK